MLIELKNAQQSLCNTQLTYTASEIEKIKTCEKAKDSRLHSELECSFKLYTTQYYVTFYDSLWQTKVTLVVNDIAKNTVISATLCGDFVERHSGNWLSRNCDFPQNFHVVKLGEITVFFTEWNGWHWMK